MASTSVEKKALLAVNAYKDRWNARDVSGLGETLHFPYIRIASGKVVTMNKGDSSPNFFQNFAEQTGWEYSLWDYRRVIQSRESECKSAINSWS